MGWNRKRNGSSADGESYHNRPAGRRSDARCLRAIGAACLLLLPAASSAGDRPEPQPVERGTPSAYEAEVIALCPDIGERPEVFLAREGEGLATHLARGPWKVYLVDPWSTPTAAAEGFDGVVRDVYPWLLQRLAEASGHERVTWIGHGVCGLLPLAAAARPSGNPPPTRWVALGTRFDWSLPSPVLERWVDGWRTGAPPLPDLVQRLLFTGLRAAVGSRNSSVPRGVQVVGTPAESLEFLHRDTIARTPPAGVLDDLARWMSQGRITDRSGWVDYEAAYANVRGPALLVAGASDGVAPPEQVLPALDRLAPEVGARWHLLSRISGDREEYGHLGMLLSRHAARDVDPLITAWLQGRRTLP